MTINIALDRIPHSCFDSTCISASSWFFYLVTSWLMGPLQQWLSVGGKTRQRDGSTRLCGWTYSAHTWCMLALLQERKQFLNLVFNFKVTVFRASVVRGDCCVGSLLLEGGIWMCVWPADICAKVDKHLWLVLLVCYFMCGWSSHFFMHIFCYFILKTLIDERTRKPKIVQNDIAWW